ncbi:hypothetical protein DB30_04278 [Enhygromyxa salina]|uniref:Uncharacterized protein n=1 Tax=Enhygromyxa salina TaxID=215803 RepID=A0A0C1ZGB3_9BACT|nr:hypothetical protein [Enhygromyxa salina]KIG16659.1 hypothetical protein DB30_04278 [Enhygromyxa salina]
MAVRRLYDRVKFAESKLDDPTPVFAVVGARMHEILHLLFHPTDIELQGCMISMIRRVGMDAAAIDRLLSQQASWRPMGENRFAEALAKAEELTKVVEDGLLELLECGTSASSPGWVVAPSLGRSRRQSTADALRRAEARGNPRAGDSASMIEKRLSAAEGAVPVP